MRRKKLLLLLLAVVMGLVLLNDKIALSSADAGGAQVSGIRNRSAELTENEVVIQFANKSQKLIAEPNVVGDGAGSAYPSFIIDINMSKLSSPGGKDPDSDDPTDYPKTEDNTRLKEGDYILIPIPKEVELRDYFFANPKNPFYLSQGEGDQKVHFAEVTKVVDLDAATKEIKSQHLKVTFNKNVDHKNFVRANIKFESTLTVVQDGNIDFNFDVFGKKVVLTVEAKRKFVYINHILKKDPANVEERGEFGIFKFTLLGNRNQTLNDTVIIQDELVNGTPERAFEFDNIGFDKTSFVIEEGNFSPNNEKEIVSQGKKIYTTEQIGYGEVGVYDDQKDTFSFNNDTLILSFDKKENPHKFQLLIKNPNKKGYKVSYGVKVPKSEIGRGYVLTNNYTMLNEDLKEIPLGYTDTDKKPIVKKELSFLASGSISSSIKGKVLIKKQEKGTSKPIADAVFRIYKKNEPNHLAEQKTDESGNLVFDNLALGKNEQDPIIYEIKEISAPTSYVQPDPTVVVKEVSLYKGDPNSHDNKKKWGKMDAAVIVQNERKTIDIEVKKVWAGEGAEEKEITFTLKRKVKDSVDAPEEFTQDKVEVLKKLEKDTDPMNNVVTFLGLHQYNEKNEEYEYYVSESKVDGYQSSGDAVVVQDPTDKVWKAVITNTKNQPPVQPQPLKPQDPAPSGGSGEDNGSGTIPKVEKIEPKKEEQPKPQPPKAQEPKPEEPKAEKPKAEEPESQEPATEVSTEKINVDGSTSDKNKTDVLPDSVPKTSSQKEDKNKTAVDPQSIKKLPKTGEGLNASAYTAIFAMLGLSFVGFGAYKKLKNTK